MIRSVQILARFHLQSRVRIRHLSATVHGKFKVLFCSDKFPSGFQYTKQRLAQERNIEVVCCPEEKVVEEIKDAVVAVPFMTRLNEHLIDRSCSLRMIIQYGAGLEGVDIPYASKKGIWVSNIPTDASANAVSCAEHIIYLALSLLRSQQTMNKSIINKRLGHPIGQTLFGKRVLVIGFGGIAKKLIPMLKAFNVHITVARRQSWSNLTVEDSTLANLIDEKCVMNEVSAVLPDIDVVALALPLDKNSEGIIDQSFLSKCRDGVMIINVCRGGLLDEKATLNGLETGKIGGLGLDVYWKEPINPNHGIFRYPNVVATPHIAGVTQESYQGMAQIIANEVVRITNGEEPSVVVNRHLLSSGLRL